MSECKCLQCGAETKRFLSSGRPRKYCSYSCRRKHKYLKNLSSYKERVRLEKEKRQAHRVCQSCGKLGIGRRNKFCDSCKPQHPKCVDCGSPIRINAKRCKPCNGKQNIKPEKYRKCQHCGKDYINTRRNKGEGEKYCSRECSWSARPAAPKFSVVHECTCVVCDRVWISQRKVGVCSEVCRKEHERYQLRKSEFKKLLSRRYPARDCLECGVLFTPIMHEHYGCCSSECARKRNIRASRLKRKAAQRRVQVERVYPFKVFDRDRWKCQGCGCDTPRHLRGTHEDSAPELDHVIPLSCGGKHSYDNTQLLCRLCNHLKRDMTMKAFVNQYLTGV